MMCRAFLLIPALVLCIGACARTDRNYGRNITYMRIDTIGQAAEHMRPDVVRDAEDLNSLLQSMVRHGVKKEDDIEYLSRDFWNEDSPFERTVEGDTTKIDIKCKRKFSGGLGDAAITIVITKRERESNLVVERHWKYPK